MTSIILYVFFCRNSAGPSALHSVTTDFGLSDDDRAAVSELDSAIEEGNSESQQLQPPVNSKQESILKEARDMLVKKPATSEDLRSGEAHHQTPEASFQQLSMTETMNDGGDDNECSDLVPLPATSEDGDDSRLPRAAASASDRVQDFMSRLRNQVNVTLPPIPGSKSFQGQTMNFEATDTEALNQVIRNTRVRTPRCTVRVHGFLVRSK